MTDKHTPMTSNPVQKHANSPTRINKAPQNPPTFTSPPSQIAPHTKSSKNHRTCRLQIGRRDDAAAKAGEGREAGQGAPPTIRAYDPPGGRVIADSGAGLSSRPRPGIRVGREMGRRKGAAPGSGFPLPPPKSDSLSPARRALALPWGGEAKNACSCSDAGFSLLLLLLLPSLLRLIEGEIGFGSFPPFTFRRTATQSFLDLYPSPPLRSRLRSDRIR